MYIAVYNNAGELFAAWSGRGTLPPRKLSWGQNMRVESQDSMLTITAPLATHDEMHGAITAAFVRTPSWPRAVNNLVTTLALGAGLLLAGLVIAAQIGNMIRRRIVAVAEVAQAVAAGNLRQAPLVDPRQDEIGCWRVP